MRATRPNGWREVNVGGLSGRFVNQPLRSGRVSFFIGIGAGLSTETNFMHSYGLDGLVGAKVALADNASIRLDGVWDFLANQSWKSYQSVRLGMSVYRRPSHVTITPVDTRTIVERSPPAVMMPHTDSVSAEEMRRLRHRDAALNALRASLRNAPRPAPAP